MKSQKHNYWLAYSAVIFIGLVKFLGGPLALKNTEYINLFATKQINCNLS